MNKKNYGTIPYYDFLLNQRQVCIILILSVSSIFFITSRISKATEHQKNSNLNTGQTNNASSLQYIPAVCGGTTTQKGCGASTVLTADAGQSNYLWSTTETTQSITVNTPGTYWWETIDMANNKVVNGDFSAGNSSFTSDYGSVVSPTSACTSNCTNVLGPEGLYSITTNPNFTHTAFQDMGDHTTGTGNLMVVNGAPTNNKFIWKQTINIQKNTDYIFSIWFVSVTGTNPGKLKFSIGGVNLNNAAIVLSSTVGLWQNFTVRWNSGNNTTADIGILNQNTNTNGNDFALDDIVFAPVCRNSIVVTFSPYPPKPSITPL